MLSLITTINDPVHHAFVNRPEGIVSEGLYGLSAHFFV